MWKSSIIKITLYIGVFTLGYFAGQSHKDDSAIAPRAQIVQAPATPSCPADNTADAKATDPSLANANTVSTPAKPDQNPPAAPREINLSDFDNPDEQIQLSLNASPETFTQSNEQLTEDQDMLAPLYQLEGEQQLAYVQKLVESQEDSAIVALNDLILNDGTPLQDAAINGLISLLEMRTGHFDVIAANLAQNAVFLNEKQLQKLHDATQPPTPPEDAGL